MASAGAAAGSDLSARLSRPYSLGRCSAPVNTRASSSRPACRWARGTRSGRCGSVLMHLSCDGANLLCKALSQFVSIQFLVNRAGVLGHARLGWNRLTKLPWPRLPDSRLSSLSLLLSQGRDTMVCFAEPSASLNVLRARCRCWHVCLVHLISLDLASSQIQLHQASLASASAPLPP